ncbi:hypothetical protein FRC07_002733 [Ceratobasidium sp. 392]|nr:hypothetical protein FRC07_002733 [Ceratobasidium sp. 392]
MPPKPGDIVRSQLAKNPPDPNARPATPEPTTLSGVRPGHAALDTPSPRRQSWSVSGPRNRRSTERGEELKRDNEKKAARREKIIRTRQRNLARRAHIESQGDGNGNGNGSNNNGGNHIELPESRPRRRGRSSTIRDLSRSPTPGCTDREPESLPPIQPQTQPARDSQYTFVYETLDHDGLVWYAQDRLNINLCSSDTQTILTLLRLSKGKQAPEVGPSGLPPSVQGYHTINFFLC